MARPAWAEQSAYDTLPQPIREAFQRAAFNFDAVQARVLLISGVPVDEIVGAIAATSRLMWEEVLANLGRGHEHVQPAAVGPLPESEDKPHDPASQ